MESEQKSKSIPFYTKAGGVASLILMAILITMILKNCVASVKHGRQTEMGTVDSYYQVGIRDGQLAKEFSLPADVMENPVLRKAYNRGYREGIDNRRFPGQ
ncbi:MAG: hypothetical protein ABFS18_07400 [Thermodesulfobacteriota bacterium]